MLHWTAVDGVGGGGNVVVVVVSMTVEAAETEEAVETALALFRDLDLVTLGGGAMTEVGSVT